MDYLKEHGVPNVIDKTVFPKIEPVLRGAVISALRFLGLVDEQGVPSQKLRDLATNDDNRPQTLRPILETAYANLFAGNLEGMTPSQFDNTFTPEAYSVNGDTMAKARTFFLKAAEFAKVPLSSHLTRRSRTSTARKKKTTPKDPAAKGATNPLPPASTTPNQHEKTIELTGGGKLTLALSVNLWDLKGADRTFVFGLMDKIDEYESPNAAVSGKEVSE